jgi:hypothetical protein
MKRSAVRKIYTMKEGEEKILKKKRRKMCQLAKGH